MIRVVRYYDSYCSCVYLSCTYLQHQFAYHSSKERADPINKGGEYRSLLGLPGGTKHPQYQQVEEAAAARGMKLVEGKGNDPDTLGKKIVYVMDSNKFPFYQAEVCK